MRKQDIILNLLLLLSLIGLGWKFRNDWRNYVVENGPQRLDIRPLSGVSLPPPAPVPDYTAVARQNPFHPDRNDIIEEPSALAKTIGPPPLIYGSFILGDDRFALMSTEQSTSKPERVPEGGMFQGYRLVKVLPESVILESAAGRDEIMLYNALMRLRRQQAKTTTSATFHTAAPTQVTSTTSLTPSNALTQSQMANVGPVNSSGAPNSQAAPAMAVPAGKEIRETPFGPIAVEKKRP
jgi:hypothetical protein